MLLRNSAGPMVDGAYTVSLIFIRESSLMTRSVIHTVGVWVLLLSLVLGVPCHEHTRRYCLRKHDALYILLTSRNLYAAIRLFRLFPNPLTADTLNAQHTPRAGLIWSHLVTIVVKRLHPAHTVRIERTSIPICVCVHSIERVKSTLNTGCERIAINVKDWCARLNLRRHALWPCKSRSDYVFPHIVFDKRVKSSKKKSSCMKSAKIIICNHFINHLINY